MINEEMNNLQQILVSFQNYFRIYPHRYPVHTLSIAYVSHYHTAKRE